MDCSDLWRIYLCSFSTQPRAFFTVHNILYRCLQLLWPWDVFHLLSFRLLSTTEQICNKFFPSFDIIAVPTTNNKNMEGDGSWDKCERTLGARSFFSFNNLFRRLHVCALVCIKSRNRMKRKRSFWCFVYSYS